jgi:hypothetical protein
VVPGQGPGGYIAYLQRAARLAPGFVKRTGDYEKYTRFLLVQESVHCLRGSWEKWKARDEAGELGTQYVRAAWLFRAVRETIGCYRRQLDEVCLGDATRWTLPVNFPPTQDSDHPVPPLSLEALLDLVDSEANRWDRLLTEGGTLAIPAIRGFVQNVHGLVRRAAGELALHTDAVLPKARRSERRQHDLEPAATPASPYEIFKAERLRAAFDVAQRLVALLLEIEKALQPAETSTYAPPAAERQALT